MPGRRKQQMGDHRINSKVWVFGRSTKQIAYDGLNRTFTNEWRHKYEAALIMGKPVGQPGPLKPLWSIKQAHGTLPGDYACLVTFTLKAEHYIQIPVDDDFKPESFTSQLNLFEGENS